MMQYIVDEAKKAKMNVALAAAPGESFLQAPNSLTWLLMFFSSLYLYNRMSDEIDWHKEWNFKEMHPARMLMDDTVPAVSLVISRFRTAPHLTDPWARLFPQLAMHESLRQQQSSKFDALA